MTRAGLPTERFDRALTYAPRAQDTQKRTGTKIPYAAHLMSVAARIS